jgi:hypothetical protein
LGPSRVLLPLAVLLAGCPHGALRGHVYVKDDVSYQVTLPSPEAWKQVEFAENDLAWSSRTSAHLLAANALCEDHGDPSLEVLTNHLLFGFTQRELKARKTLTLDGREALDSHYQARLDGVPVELRLLVLKKNGCVHDFSYIAPAGRFGDRQADFEKLIEGFAQVSVKQP